MPAGSMRLEKMLSRASELTHRFYLLTRNSSGTISRFRCSRWRRGRLWLRLQRRDLHDHRLAFAFATLREPRAQAFTKTFRSKTEAGVTRAIGNGQSVVEFGGIGEIAHAELIEPFERAGL